MLLNLRAIARDDSPARGNSDPMRRIGLISDTHGLLRPEALAALAGSDHIIHAGDIGDESILDDLRKIAPVTAVLGNVDSAIMLPELAETETVEMDGVRIHVLHDLGRLNLNPQVAGVSAVISGHTHEPRIFERAGVLCINPGSAGQRRFSLPVSVGFLRIADGKVSAELLELSV